MAFSTDDPVIAPIYSGSKLAMVYRPDGKIVLFNISGTTYSPVDPDTVESLVQVDAITWQFKTADDATETYQILAGTTDALLSSVTFRSGVTQTLTYAYTAGGYAPQSVTDSFGRTLAFSYDSNTGQLSSMADPSGSLITYQYNGSGYLTDVYYADGSRRQYQYNDSSNAGALTGIVDESGVTYATWAYDGQRRATQSQHAGGAEGYSFTYNPDGTTAVADAGGATRTYTFSVINGVPKYTSIVQGGLTSSATWDTNGWPLTKVDHNGTTTSYQYNSAGLEVSRTDASGTPRARTTTTSWDPVFRLPAVIIQSNRATSFTYDGSGNQLTKTITDTTVTPNVSRTWTHTYDSYGHTVTTDGPRTDVSDVTSYTYYTCTTGYECGQLQTVTDALGNVTTYNTYNAHSQPLTVTDPNGVVTTLTYDARQRLTSRQVGSETTSFTFWPTGLLQKVSLPDSSYLLYSYDVAHRLTQISDGLGNGIDYTLDVMGNRTAENVYDPFNTLHRTHTRIFNSLNQLYQDVNAAGTAAVTTTFAYDAIGNRTSIAAPLSRTTVNAYDELNRLNQITDPANGITHFGYDANDNLTSVVDPRNLTTGYTYNGLGDLTAQVSPDTGTTSNTYDSAGNLATATDARGAVSTYSYDALNRVNSIAYSNGGTTDQTIAFTYDAGMNGNGHRTGASDAYHAMSWTYDNLGRVTVMTQSVGGVSKSVGYMYTNGDLTSLTTPSGQTIAYGFNSNHQVTSVTLNGTTTILNTATYEPLGPVNGWIWGNGTAVSRTYDTDGKIASISSAGLKAYSYDDAFRIAGITDASTGAANWTFSYDLLDRITSGAGGGITRGWTYDANGNRSAETGSAASTYTIAATNNRVDSITGALARTYSYDSAGDVLTYSTVTAAYNDRGRANTIKVGSVTEMLVYNALGQMVRTSGGAGGTVLYWYDDGGHLLGEYSSTGTLIEETVWLGDIPVATLRPHNGGGVDIYYVHSDQLNTPRQVTRPSDNRQMWTWFSDPFGTTSANSNPAGGGTFPYNLRFPGQVFDGQAGLHQNGFRDFDPAVGRYAESDPIGLGGGINPYSYSGANPTSNFDPLGLYCTSAGGWTSCSYPAGPSFRLPTPDGFPASIASDTVWNFILYHKYDVGAALGGSNAKCVMQKLIENPTPGTPKPATTQGTKNNAVVLGQDNFVNSYLTSDLNTGAPLVVNMTTTGSLFGPGYVARTVTDGVAHTYGEGLNAKQSPLLTGLGVQAAANELLWGNQMRELIKSCSCGQ